jgi:hypothetical protein
MILMCSESREAIDRKAALADQNIQHQQRLLHGSPEGRYPDDPILFLQPWKGLAIPFDYVL